MPEFNYTARNRDGGVVSDVVQAQTREAAGQLLRQQGLLPTTIEEKRTKSKWRNMDLNAMLGHVSLLEKLTFIKNLSVTLKAGLPISKALQVVTQQMPNAYFRNVVSGIAHSVESGKTLSESMAKYPKVFSGIFVNMIKAGEQSGQLDKNMIYLANQIGRDYDLIRRTKGALMYPAIVFGALLIIGYIMFTFVLPKLTETFTQFEIELPFLTQVIVAVVDVFSHYSLLVIILFVIAGAAFWYWRKTKSGRLALHSLVLRIPVIGKLVRKVNLARFTIIFSGLLKSGMPIVQALNVTGDTMGNVYYQRALHEASEKVKVGIDLRVALEKHPKLFTPMVTQMIHVGEESGTMEEVLKEVAGFYEAEIDESVKNLSSIIEPVLVIVIGAVVGVLAVGLILPIYNLGSAI